MDDPIQIDWAVEPEGCPESDQIIAWVQAVLDRHVRGAASIDLRVSDCDEIRSLNREFRDRDQATNVLSFPAEVHPALGINHLGDVIICAEIVAREAAEQDKPIDHHWAHLVIHGILHLVGFDHIDDQDAERMEAEECEILATIGVPDPYH